MVACNSSTVFCNPELALRITKGWCPSLPSDRRTVTKATPAAGDCSVALIADIGVVVDTSLAVDSLPDADIATACDIHAGLSTQGRVVAAGGVVEESPMAVLWSPSVLFWSAKAPVAVFKAPVVLNWSATVPVAVFKLPVALLESAL
jgi:hypothetical protein